MNISKIKLAESAAMSLAAPAVIRRPLTMTHQRGLFDLRKRFGANSPLRRFFCDSGLGMTFDKMTVDSTGSFLIGELEKLDMRLHGPLATVTWGRDIKLREDVTIADEVSSFTNSTFAAAGGINPNGIAWIGKNSNQITGMQLDIGKTVHPLTLWGTELSWTIPELLSAQQLGRPVDDQKFVGMNLKHQMDIDQMVYIGDTSTISQTGLVNNASVYETNVAAGASGFTQWVKKSPDEILLDFSTAQQTVWTNSAYVLPPDSILIPPNQFSYISTAKVSIAGERTILTYIEENCLSTKALGRKVRIAWLKWLPGAGAGGLDRMVCYTNDIDRVRYPMTALQRTPLENRSIYQLTTYFCRLGVVEFVYPESVGYFDGI